MADRQHGRGRLGLGVYLVPAAVVHAALLALVSVRTRSAAARDEPVERGPTVVDVEPELPPPATTSPGGGSPVAAPTTDVVARAPPLRTARAPRPVAPVASAAARTDAVVPVADDDPAAEEPKKPAGPDPNEVLAIAEARADNDRRDRAMATGWTGLGPWAGDEGTGAGWGAPTVRAVTPFGGPHGALTGRICFFPPDTLRIADVQSCRYVAKVYTDVLDVPERQSFEGFPGVPDRSDWFLIDYTGKFLVTGYGTFEFRLHSDDGSYLYIDDQLIIENDGKHAPESKSGRVQLAVGEHRIRVLYAQTTDRMALQLFVTPPGAPEAIFTPRL